MRNRVVRFGDADLWIRPRADLARQLEGDHAGDVRLQREHLQIEHQLDVFLPRLRRADRPLQVVGQRRAVLALGHLDPPFDLTHRVEVFADAAAIRRAELPLEAAHVLADPVEDAAVPAQLGLAFGRAAAIPEHAFEHHARIGLGRERRGRRRPRQRVHVGAGEAVVAGADDVVEVGRELERGQRRGLADLLRRELVDGHAQLIVGTGRGLGLGRAQERAVGGRVVGRRVRVLVLEIRDDRQLVEVRRQRAEDRRQLGDAAGARPASSRRCARPSECRRIPAAGPGWRRCAPSLTGPGPWRRAAAAPASLRRRAGTSGAAGPPW